MTSTTQDDRRRPAGHGTGTSTSTSTTVHVNGLRLHVVERGTRGPALVFLHYWGGSARTWAQVVDALPADQRCVLPDLRGWGASEAPPGDDAYALADLGADIAALVGRLGLRRHVLVGHSMGGKVAQLLAARRPPGLAGLVLVAPAPPGPLALPPAAIEAMRTAYATRDGVEAAIDHMLTARTLAPAVRAQVIEDSLRGAPGAKSAWPTRTSREDIRAALDDIAVPVMVIAGTEDRVDSLATLRTGLLPYLRDADLRVLEGVGHLSPLEAPDAVAGCIAAFVARLDAGTGALSG
ncbi:alpha/beta fold hydrolase [uncultured Massilia sp.]|uniref:alpha/beta fold hydrolase n=1 Tax=uncultured Massilia sp. TaxID=169973 RepID=UPI0025F25F21|nr:alpha/beta hydrolase [uncultured Massilia sp.]